MPRMISPSTAPVVPLRPPPPPPQPFVGRERERASLASRLEDRNVVAVTGIVGAGKTSLLADYAAHTHRLVEWIEIYRGLSDSGEALLWQIARPLADLSAQTWQSLHRMAQCVPPYPLAARFQVVLAAYARLKDSPLLIIDGVDHLAQPEAAALVVALCDHVASGRAGDLRLVVAGRALPYRLQPYALPPLAGLDVAATQRWAQELGFALADTAATELLAASGGVPIALSDILSARAADATASAETDRRLWALLAGLSPDARALLIALTHGTAPPTLSLERRVDLAQLEDLHLVRRNTSSAPLVHPMIRTFIGTHPDAD